MCFAFGQTGAGKTYTLLGNKSVRGLYELAASDLFALADASSSSLDVVASYYEIYCGRLYDLLTKRTRSHSTSLYSMHAARSHRLGLISAKNSVFWSTKCLVGISKCAVRIFEKMCAVGFLVKSVLITV